MDEQDFKLLYFIFKQDDTSVPAILVKFHAYPEITQDTEARIDKLIAKDLLEKVNSNLHLTVYGYKAVNDYIDTNPISCDMPFLTKENISYLSTVMIAICSIINILVRIG
ncbi:MAG: hypothetical protein IJZ69_04425 [Bacteroidales bacterium]|nr:hypothetical protein [Bacteroidales bacterium]MBQ8809560.1 hypothetical protein [Bacteroidales bacterium]